MSDKKYVDRPSFVEVMKSEISWEKVVQVVFILFAILLGCVILYYSGKGIVHLVKTYSYNTEEILSERSDTYSKVWPIYREYKPAWTEYYYYTDSDGTRHRRTRRHSAEYYFTYDGGRHNVSKSVYDMPYNIAIMDYQKRTYIKVPCYPDYPNKVDTNPYVKEVQIGDVKYQYQTSSNGLDIRIETE